MKKTNYIIPIFIPELACPHQCVFCNQQKISGQISTPSSNEVRKIIETHLSTIPLEGTKIEIAFFGGNFTGIEIPIQIEYLQIANEYIKSGIVSSIRLSTRPDYITPNILQILSDHSVKTIELGAQSLHDDVLKKSGRGHTVRDIKTAAKLIKEKGFELGLQMMIGLPGDDLDKALSSAETICDLGADNTRIYPTLVIRDTKLADFFLQGKYSPLTLEDAVTWTSKIYRIFERRNIQILRVGLHPSEGLLNGNELLAGPFHQSFRELVFTELWRQEFEQLNCNNKNGNVVITVNPKEINYAIGYKSSNRIILQQHFGNVVYKTNADLLGREYCVSNC